MSALGPPRGSALGGPPPTAPRGSALGQPRSALNPGGAQDDEDKIERPVITDQDVTDAGEALMSNPFTVSESFNRLEEGTAKHIFSGNAKGSETVFGKEARAPVQQQVLKNVPQGHCVACGEKLKGKFTRIRDHGFHHDCFNCAVCGKNLRGIGYYQANGNIYCKKDRPL